MFSTSYATMRKFVGWLGLSLPFVLPAGIFAVGVAFFPTSPAAASPHQQNIGHIHFVFAALLFTMLAIMALRFTKTNPDGDPTPQKSRRNVIYVFCAALI